MLKKSVDRIFQICIMRIMSEKNKQQKKESGMKLNIAEVDMKVKTADTFSTQIYNIKRIHPCGFLVDLEYKIDSGIMVSGGTIDISMIKRVK
jgi:hypothetical protein